MKIKAKLPSNRQPDISRETYDALSATPQCGRLLRGECDSPCEVISDDEYSVDIDHIVWVERRFQPTAPIGDNTE